MKRALYIGGFTMPDGNAAAQRVLGVAKLLRLCDYNVRLCGLSRHITTGIEKGVIEDIPYCNYHYPASVFDWWQYLTGHGSAISEIESYQPQIVILYNHPAFAIEYIVKYCHKIGIKVLADITEWYGAYGNRIFRTIKEYDTKRRMTYSHLKLDGLICISSYLAEYYRNHNANVLELPPLVDIKQSKWHQSTEKHSDDELRMVYAGSPGTTKDRLDLILKALDNIIPTLKKTFRFDVIGITEEQYRIYWGDHTERKFVVFNGRIPHTEVIKKILEADFQIFLRPDNLTNRAGFPTKFVETITSRTLPITNLSSNLSKYLRDGHNGFVISSLDQKSIEKTLSRALFMSPCQLEDMKNNIDLNEFDFRNYLREYIDFAKTL